MKNSKLKKIFIIIIFIIMLILFKMYIISRVHVSGPSMSPTLNNNDSVLIEKVSLLNKKFRRGEVIIFDSGNKNHSLYIKRIIGLEGDKIEIKHGSIYINHIQLKEPYIKNNIDTHGGTFLHDNQLITIKKGFVFVLGDDRILSNDSRYFGEVNTTSIKGHVVLKIFPFNDFKIF